MSIRSRALRATLGIGADVVAIFPPLAECTDSFRT
jgi:hypothetical protein